MKTNRTNDTEGRQVYRKRPLYLILLIFTIGSGLASRQFSTFFPHWIQLYLGDALWALMVFLLIGIIFRGKTTLWVAIAAIAFSFGIELSQLYHATWIDALRSNPLGGLVLGFGFLWSDLVCYTVGVGVGFAMEMFFLKK